MSMTPNPPVAPAPSSRPPGPSLALSLLVGTLGIVIGVVAVVAIIIPLVDHLGSDAYRVPGEIHLHLKHERYLVYQREEFADVFGAVNLSPATLTVTGPDRATVPVEFDGRDEKFSKGSTDYRSTLSFEPPASGDYELVFTNRLATEVVVARSTEDVVRSVLVWFGVAALGGAVLLAGIILLIIGVTRRGRAKRAAYAAWGPPGGAWYQVNPPQQWGPPGGAPAYPPSGYPQPQYPPPGYGPPGSPPVGYPPPPPAYPPPPAPPAPAPAAPPADEPDQPNP
jgi:hypothetical protein